METSDQDPKSESESDEDPFTVKTGIGHRCPQPRNWMRAEEDHRGRDESRNARKVAVGSSSRRFEPSEGYIPFNEFEV